MTLERHKSRLIPEIQYSLDGTLFVTDTGGTFPLRGKSPHRADVRDHEFTESPPPPEPSFRSLDIRREEKTRRYKQRLSSSRDPSSEMSTLSNNTSSLGRRLRRSKRSSTTFDTYGKEKYFSQKSNGSMSGQASTRRLGSGPPRMTPEFADTLRRNSRRRSAGKGSIGEGSSFKKKRKYDDDADVYDYRLSKSSGYGDKIRCRQIHEERLPYILFLIDGVLLILIGVARILVSYWHEYYCSLVAGVLILLLGASGSKHKGLYLSKSINGLYIFLAFLSGAATMAASGLVLYVFVPMVMKLTDDVRPEEILRNITFTNMNQTLSTIQISPSAVVWSSLALDIGTLVFLFVGYFSMTAAMVAFSNHWDACYDATAECDHRGNPRMFNPIEQVVLGVASTFVGLVYLAAEAGFPAVHHQHYYAPLWSCGMMVIAGCISFCFGKRPDQLAMGTFASFVEILTFLCCGAATVVTTLGLVKDINEISDKTGSTYKQILGMTIIGSALDLMLTINVIFIVGIMFRQCRQVCCHSCCGIQSTENEVSRFNSLDRNKYGI